MLALEEEKFISGFHEQIKKEREKAWHDRNIQKNIFQEGYLMLLYDRNFMKFLGKFQTH